MKIVHVVEATFAGVGRHVLDLARAQAAAGHDVGVAYSPRRESGSFREERGHLSSVNWHPVEMSRSPHPSDIPAIRRVRSIAGDADILHGHSTKGGLVARLVGGPSRVFYTPNAVYSMNPSISRSARAAVGVLERGLSWRTDQIIAVSPEEAAHLRSIGVADNRISVVLNGTEAIEPSDPGSVRTSLGLPLERPVIGFLGRLDDQKAPLDLIEIFKHALRHQPDLHLAVVGDGPLRRELEQSVPTGLADRVSLLGERPGTWAMCAFDVLALPSRYEGFPYVLLEAAAQGLPFVASEHCNASELISRGASGKITPRLETERFASDLAVMASRRARHAPVIISVTQMTQQVETLYSESHASP